MRHASPFLAPGFGKGCRCVGRKGRLRFSAHFLPYKNVQFAADARKDRKNRVTAGFFRLGNGRTRSAPCFTAGAGRGGAPNMKKDR
jgi:hypothetical protein